MTTIKEVSMDTRKYILQETGIILLGQALCVAVMDGFFALLHAFDQTVLLGGIVGGLIATINFFAMSMAAMIASEKALNQDVKGGKTTLKMSQTGRLLAIAAVLIIFAKSGYCHVIAMVLPLVFTRPILTVREFFRKSGEKSV